MSQSTAPPSGIHSPDQDMIELLRSILEGNTGKNYSFDDASEISAELISLYECIARDRKQPSTERHG